MESQAGMVDKVDTNRDWVKLLKMVNQINNPNIRKFTYDFLVKKVPDYFARIPASASGKYHPAESLGYGGLLRHTMAVATIAYDICRLEYLQLKPYDQDLIYAACLLHDTYKQGLTESGTTIRSHPNVAAQEILKYAKEVNEEKIGRFLAGLVVSHMGSWGNQKPGNRAQFLVHLADYIASRRYITMTYDHLLGPAPTNNK